jgi:hypothetical protein
VATACAALGVETEVVETEDAEMGAAANALPFEAMSEPPPLLLRRIAERMGGRAPPVVVLELVPKPLAAVFLPVGARRPAVGPPRASL